MKKQLIKWNKEHFGNIFDQKAELEKDCQPSMKKLFNLV